MKIQPEDYCALVCRDPNRLRLVNAHPEVVEVIERCLEVYSLDYDLYFKSKVTCAFKLHSQPFRKSGCSEEKTIKIKEFANSILVIQVDVDIDIELFDDLNMTFCLQLIIKSRG